MEKNALTNVENIVLFKDFRISVLKDGIIRIEKDTQHKFNDFPTQKVLYRNFKKVAYSSYIIDEYLVIELRKYKLYFNGILEESYILYKDEKIALDNICNLGGTYETVDGMDGEVQTIPGVNYQIGLGICSTNGVAILDDSDSYCFDDEMNFSHKNSSELDLYVFFYPLDYINAVKNFFEISGYPPMLPKYVFGNWWSRFYAYSHESYVYLMDKYAKENIPFTIATVDMDWHYSPSNGRNLMTDLDMSRDEFLDEEGNYYCKHWNDSNPWSIGWTGYTWNKKLFADYEQFLKDLRARGLHVTLNLHPADGVAFYEDMYERCAAKVGFDTSKKETIPFDLIDDDYRKMFFEEITNYYEDKGVDFWWIDWQQGSFSKFPGLTPMWLCNHYFYQNRAKRTNRPLILSRCCGAGGHRYPLGFSGDSFQTFDSLKYLVKTTSMATNIGFTYWSHDIGGHMHGVKDGDLYLKFIQFGVFSPVMRIHSACNEPFSKEPDLYLNGYGEMSNKWLRLRHKMIPYLYSYSLQTSKDGRGLIEPIYYHYPKDKLCFEYKDGQYFFAKDLLVAPYVERKDANDINRKKVYFPTGTYYDLKYGYKYCGRKEVEIIRETGDMPVFIKEGAFFVLDNNNYGNEVSNPKELEIITTTGNGKYVLVEDDQNKTIKTSFVNNKKDSTIKIKITGAKNLYQKDRKYMFKLLNVFDYDSLEVSNATISDIHTVGGCLEFVVSDVMFNKEVVITYKEKAQSKLDLAKKYTLQRILYIDDVNDIRNDLYESIVKANTVKEIKENIKNSKVSNLSKEIILEVLHF